MRSRPLVLSTCSALVTGVLVLGAAAPSAAVVQVQEWSDRLEVRVIDQPGQIQIRCANGRVQLEPGWGEGYSQCDRVRRIHVSLDHGGYEDVVEFDAFSDPRQFTMLEGLTVLSPPDRRRDVVRGSQGSDHVTGDALDQVSTGAGNDVVTGEIEGPGVVSAGDGNDTIDSVQVFDTFTGTSEMRFEERAIHGGAGSDAWSATLRLREPGIVLDASGLANGSRRMQVTGIESASLTLLGSSDFNAELFPGTLVLSAQGGNDRLVGTRTYDSISAGDGADWVWVRDGVADKVDCGAGVDTVVADVADVVTNCETVTLPAPPPPPPAPGTPPRPSEGWRGHVSKFSQARGLGSNGRLPEKWALRLQCDFSDDAATEGRRHHGNWERDAASHLPRREERREKAPEEAEERPLPLPGVSQPGLGPAGRPKL